MVTPPTGRPFHRPRKDDIRFQPEGYILGFAKRYMLQGKSQRAALIDAIKKVEKKRRVGIENRYRALLRLAKTRSEHEQDWFELVSEAVRLAEDDCRDNDLKAAAERVDTAAEAKLRFRLGEGRRLGQLNKEPGWLLNELRPANGTDKNDLPE